MAEAEDPDEQLASLSKDGNIDAFNSLVQRYEIPVYNLCYRLSGHRQAAEDATQEAFISAYRSLARFSDGSFRRWYFRIAANESKDELRRRARKDFASSLDGDGPMRPLAFLMPLAALVITVTVVGVVCLSHEPPTGTQAAVDSARPSLEPAGPDGPQPRRQAGDVCQGVIKRPEKGQTATFHEKYTQQRHVLGITIVGNARVSGAAFDVAEATITRMFSGNDLETRLVEEGAYVIIADRTQGVLDLPEFACLGGDFADGFYANVCGVADRADYPVATVNELDLIGSRSGPCRGLNILYHELGHLVQGWTLDHPDYLDARLFYQSALDSGKYKRAYAARNSNEYFAEGVQAYFLHVEPEGGKDRAWLKRYDLDLFELLARIFGD